MREEIEKRRKAHELKTGGRGSLIRILLQTAGNKVAECRTPLIRILEGRNAACVDEEESFERWKVDVGRISFCQLHQQDSKTPDVDFLIIVNASDQFGGHPVRRPDNSVSLSCVHLGCISEIRCLVALL